MIKNNTNQMDGCTMDSIQAAAERHVGHTVDYCFAVERFEGSEIRDRKIAAD